MPLSKPSRTSLAPAGGTTISLSRSMGQAAPVAAPSCGPSTSSSATPRCGTGFRGRSTRLGLRLVASRFERAAIVASIPWAVGIWWVGERFGALPTGFGCSGIRPSAQGDPRHRPWRGRNGGALSSPRTVSAAGVNGWYSATGAGCWHSGRGHEPANRNSSSNMISGCCWRSRHSPRQARAPRPDR